MQVGENKLSWLEEGRLVHDVQDSYTRIPILETLRVCHWLYSKLSFKTQGNKVLAVLLRPPLQKNQKKTQLINWVAETQFFLFKIDRKLCR